MYNIKKRGIIYMVLVLFGLSLFILSENLNYIDQFWSGFGIGLLIIGSLRLIQIWRFKTNEEYARKLSIQQSDERNYFLVQKAAHLTFRYIILLECLTIIITTLINLPEISTMLGILVGLQLFVYYITYIVLKRKY